MGFGWLFLGYFVTFLLSLNPYGAFVIPIGLLLLLEGINILYKYCHRIAYCLAPMALMGVVGIFNAVLEVLHIVGIETSGSMNTVSQIADWGYFIGVLGFQIAFMLAIWKLANSVELPRIASKAVRNFIVYAVFSVIYIVSHLPLSTIDEFKKMMALPYTILNLAWIFLGLILLGSCYMRICPEGDEDMPDKRSNVELVNKMNDALNRQGDKIEKSQHEYYLEKRSKKMLKVQKKKSKK